MTSHVKFLGTAAAVVPLGFGCSNLLGDKTRAEGLRLLAAAHEVGVRHFDVARYYGYGDAEGVVGDFVRTVPRHTVTITTKFGLQPMRAAGRLKGAVASVRRLMRASPLARKLVSRHAHRLVHRGRFDVASARASLETSLRQLRTEYVDVLLLHEPAADDCTPELLDFLSHACDQGHIRLFGTGAAFGRTTEAVARHPRFSAVVQFESDAFDDHVRDLRAVLPSVDGSPFRHTTITHGSLSSIRTLLNRIGRDDRFRRAAAELLQCDPAVPDNLAAALLAASVRSNRGGLVLFRSTDPNRISRNVQAVRGRFSDGQLGEFTALCRTVCPPTSQP